MNKLIQNFTHISFLNDTNMNLIKDDRNSIYSCPLSNYSNPQFNILEVHTERAKCYIARANSNFAIYRIILYVIELLK